MATDVQPGFIKTVSAYVLKGLTMKCSGDEIESAV
jgi:hypothetical protein